MRFFHVRCSSCLFIPRVRVLNHRVYVSLALHILPNSCQHSCTIYAPASNISRRCSTSSPTLVTVSPFNLCYFDGGHQLCFELTLLVLWFPICSALWHDSPAVDFSDFLYFFPGVEPYSAIAPAPDRILVLSTNKSALCYSLRPDSSTDWCLMLTNTDRSLP